MSYGSAQADHQPLRDYQPQAIKPKPPVKPDGDERSQLKKKEKEQAAWNITDIYKAGDENQIASALLSPVYATGVLYIKESVGAPRENVDDLKGSIKKAVQLFRGSPNLMTSIKYGLDLGSLYLRAWKNGVSLGEIQEWGKEAMAELKKQNRLLNAENERNYVLLHVTPGQKKSELRVVGEIRKQLQLQAQRIGMPNSQLEVMETQLAQAQAVLDKFQGERQNLQGQIEQMEGLKGYAGA
jgi:hypothetical protein